MNTSATNKTTEGYLAQIKLIGITSYSINLILGLPSNVYVLWLIVTRVGGTIASEFFSLNLTIFDSLFCVSAILYFIWIKYPTIVVTCIQFSFVGLFLTAHPMFQCCICVERYLAVVHPVIYLKYKPLRYRVGCCVVIWLMVLGSCLFYLLTNNTYIYNIYCGEFLGLFLVKLFCCLSVLRALKRPGPGEGVERQETNDMKMRAFRIILINLVPTLINNILFVVVIPFQFFFNAEEYLLALYICFFITLIFGFVQPLLYIHIHSAGKMQCLRAR